MNDKKLNQQTLDHLKNQHPRVDQFDRFVSTCLREARTALRVNTEKISVASFTQHIKPYEWDLETIPWSDEGFWITASQQKALGNHIYHLSGLFYLQESTSMLPVEALFHQNNPNLILDMAAAPGSKTSQLANKIEDGFIVANDMSSSRVKMLNANLIRCGIAQFGLLHQDARNLIHRLDPVFDGILLDAPCGGEGTIRKDPKAWNNWSLESLAALSDLQRQLIVTAWKLLKPGGRLIYSTCSLSQEENQHVVKHLLNTVGCEANIINLSTLFSGAEDVCNDAMLHLWPEVFDTEGFFVAAIEKSSAIDNTPSTLNNNTSTASKPPKKLWSEIVAYFQQRFGFNLSSYADDAFITQSGKKQTIWLKAGIPSQLHHTTFQRSGIRLCEAFQSRNGTGINLEHEFCRTYGHHFTESVVELSTIEAVNFYKGLNIKKSVQVTEGEVLLTLLGQPIGSGKILKNGQIKNQLPRSLVHDNAWG